MGNFDHRSILVDSRSIVHCQVNITNQLGETPLHLAVENAKGSAGDENPTELVQFLVDR